jgi:hypothetical protein
MATWINLNLASSDGLFLGYTPHGRKYRMLNLETNTIVKSCDVTFSKTAHCLCDVFEGDGGEYLCR